ncbi:unnamed protein product [Peniophora sp. CBMAI 1063]|nr:unnamed protein product [Peniophora sp. CBMAI 1063]
MAKRSKKIEPAEAVGENRDNVVANLPAELIGMIATYLREMKPAGILVTKKNGTYKTRKWGWMKLMQVCSWWRKAVHGTRVLWALDAFSFPVKGLIKDFAIRAGDMSLVIDLDRLLDSCCSKSHSNDFHWLFQSQEGRGLLSKARIISGTFSLGRRNNSTVNYYSNDLSVPSLLKGLNGLRCPKLTTLVVPYTRSASLQTRRSSVNSPQVHGPCLTTLRLVGLGMDLRTADEVKGGYARTGYEASRAWTCEPMANLSSLLDAINKLPVLEELHLDGMHFQIENAKSPTPVTVQSLRRVLVRCSEHGCLPTVMKHITAPNARWDIVTRIQPPNDVYELLWSVAGLGEGNMRLYVEDNDDVKWFTFTQPGDAGEQTPIFSDGSDHHDIQTHRRWGPNIYARPGRLSIAYEGDVNTPIELIMKSRVTTVVYAGRYEDKGDIRLWAKPHDDWRFTAHLSTECASVYLSPQVLCDSYATHASCPSHITFICNDRWYGPSGLEQLSVALSAWDVTGKHPTQIVIAGVKRWWDNEAVASMAANYGERVVDQREATGLVFRRPADPLMAELQVARHNYAHAKMRELAYRIRQGHVREMS